MRLRQSTCVAFVVLAIGCGAVIFGCGNSGDKADATRPTTSNVPRLFNPPEVSYARGLGISGGPVTGEQARAIAESATGGVAKGVEQEDEDGVQVFGVEIDATDGALDVKIRVSDGAVIKIESDENDDDDSGDDEGSDSDEN